MTLDDMIAMARQMLWRDANDERTKIGHLVEVHQWLMALEAAKSQGEPEQVWNVDLNGWPLTDLARKQEADLVAQANAENDETEEYDRYKGDEGRSTTTGY